jgi:hypothetical protein
MHPRIVAEDDVGGDRPDPAGDLSSLRQAGLDLTVGPAEEDDLGRPAEGARRLALFGLPRGDEPSRVRRGIPGALGTVGADRWKISDPSRAHFAKVPPHPNSMSSAWAAIASARFGVARFVVIS